jgi:Protein of unknown function (DUF2844)
MNDGVTVRPVRATTVLSVLFALLASPLACASLGDEVGSIDRDRAVLQGVTQVTASQAYETHEIAHPGGNVRQYVAGGRVFAVSWDGVGTPDLRQLLGTYHARYAALVRPQPGSHHVVAVNADGLSIAVARVLRSNRGRVVLTNLVPSAVAADSLR